MKKKILMVMLLATVGLTACSGGKTHEQKLEEARQAGSEIAEGMWSADEVEITQSSDEGKNLGAVVGEDAQKFKAGHEYIQANETETAKGENNIITFVIDRRTGLFHRPDCEEVDKITTVNRQNFYGSRDDAVAQTWQPCTICKP